LSDNDLIDALETIFNKVGKVGMRYYKAFQHIKKHLTRYFIKGLTK